MNMRLSDYDYYLPEGLIAQKPAPKRDGSRLFVLSRRGRDQRHVRFFELVDFLEEGDLLVLNDTKVIPARLVGRRRSGGRVEILLLERLDEVSYRALIKPLARIRRGEEIFLVGHSCRLRDPKEKIVEFAEALSAGTLKKIGSLPLPPYIRRPASAADARRYQTVFAREEGAIAAPTAGLHFTKGLLARLSARGVRISALTLHVNYATFAPVRSDDISKHVLSAEDFEIPAATIQVVRETKKRGGRIVAVGTTVVKALEESADLLLGDEPARRISGQSRLFIYPPFSFKVVDALVTNFHLPRTTLLMLVSAFAGRDFMLQAYREAVGQKYRFYSYGDAMLIF